jgi:hypothetical protein
LLRKWPRNAENVEDNADETPILIYSKKLDLQVLANSITRSDVEEENFPPYLKVVMSYSKEETKNLEDTKLTITP